MFHLLAGVLHRASELECADDDPIAIVSLDVKSAFNTLSRAHLAKHLLHNQQSAADSCLLRHDQNSLIVVILRATKFPTVRCIQLGILLHSISF